MPAGSSPSARLPKSWRTRAFRRLILAVSLAVDGLHAGYGAVKALRGVTLDVKAGETVALLGTNGNGKSTLIKCIMGIVRPTSGSITAEIDGKRHQLVGKTT